MRFLIALLFFVAVGHAGAAERTLAEFADPAGDDFGHGTLVYPERYDISRGDLDLRHLRVTLDDSGDFWFEATMGGAIRDPKSIRTGVGPEPVALAARRGFYSFNLDIYLDTDRKPGSGNTFTLPGRKVRIEPAYAWEKAVILTPRPESARGELVDALMRQYPDRRQAEAEASVDQGIFFATDIKVRGRSIRFRVPRSFLGTINADNMALSAFVTGARPFSSLSLGLLSSERKPLEQLDLGVMQPMLGRPDLTFGHDGSGPVLPIVDALLPTTDQQIALLAGGHPLTGRSWGLQSVDEELAAKRFDGARRGREAASPETGGNDPISALRGLFSSGSPPRPATLAISVGSLLDPASGAIPSPTEDSPRVTPTSPAVKPDISARLRTLQQLLEQKLIDEGEYKQQKQRLLGEL